MKKLGMFLLLMGFCGIAFAGAVDPCRMTAYQYCAEKLKTLSLNPGPTGAFYCTVNPTTTAFKTCEADARTRCRNGEVLDLTQKVCQ